MCAACFCPCISQLRALPLGLSRYQTSEFLNTSEFPTELPINRDRVNSERFRSMDKDAGHSAKVGSIVLAEHLFSRAALDQACLFFGTLKTLSF